MMDILANKLWLLDEDYLNRMSALIAERLHHGHTIESLIKPHTHEFLIERMSALLAMEGDGAVISMSESGPAVRSGNKNIALMAVIGPLSKYGGMCNAGMQDYQQKLNRANADPSIDGIVVIMDSPGGTTDGTPEFGLAIKNSPKPVGIFGDGMVASAAYWVASQASVIVGNKNNPTAFGSIGAYMVKEDLSNVIESGRMPKAEIIRAPQSTEKTLINPLEPLTEQARTHVREQLSGIVEMFISTVKAGRGDKLQTDAEGLFKGRMYAANDAKRIGMIDSVGTLQTAVNKVAELARLKSTSAAASTGGAQVNSKMKFPKLSNLFSGEAWSKVLSSETEDQATLEAAEQKVAAMEANGIQVQAENEQLKAEKAASDLKIAELTASVTGLEAQVSALTEAKQKLEVTVAEQKTALEQKPTGNLTTVIPGDAEEGQPADGATVKSKTFRTKADVEADKVVAELESYKIK